MKKGKKVGAVAVVIAFALVAALSVAINFLDPLEYISRDNDTTTIATTSNYSESTTIPSQYVGYTKDASEENTTAVSTTNTTKTTFKPTESTSTAFTKPQQTTKKVEGQKAISKGKENFESIYFDHLPKKMKYYIGDTPSTDGLVVKGRYSDGKTKTIPKENLDINYSSIDKDGFVKVTVKYSDTLKNSYKIEFQTPTVKITDEYIYLDKGYNYTLEAKTNPQNQKIKWISASEEIVRVSKDGTVTAVGYGATTIIAEITYKNRTYYSNPCFVSVQDENPVIYFNDVYLNESDCYIDNDVIYINMSGNVSSSHQLDTVYVCWEGFCDSMYVTQVWQLDDNYGDNLYSLNQYTYEFDFDEEETYTLYILAIDTNGNCDSYYIGDFCL